MASFSDADSPLLLEGRVLDAPTEPNVKHTIIIKGSIPQQELFDFMTKPKEAGGAFNTVLYPEMPAGGWKDLKFDKGHVHNIGAFTRTITEYDPKTGNYSYVVNKVNFPFSMMMASHKGEFRFSDNADGDHVVEYTAHSIGTRCCPWWPALFTKLVKSMWAETFKGMLVDKKDAIEPNVKHTIIIKGSIPQQVLFDYMTKPKEAGGAFNTVLYPEMPAGGWKDLKFDKGHVHNIGAFTRTITEYDPKTGNYSYEMNKVNFPFSMMMASHKGEFRFSDNADGDHVVEYTAHSVGRWCCPWWPALFTKLVKSMWAETFKGMLVD